MKVRCARSSGERPEQTLCNGPHRVAHGMHGDGGNRRAATVFACGAGTLGVARLSAHERFRRLTLRSETEFSQRENCHRFSASACISANSGMGLSAMSPSFLFLLIS